MGLLHFRQQVIKESLILECILVAENQGMLTPYPWKMYPCDLRFAWHFVAIEFAALVQILAASSMIFQHLKSVCKHPSNVWRIGRVMLMAK